jgi:hypothetical protein
MVKKLFLVLILLVSCTSKPRMITAKHKVGETYWVHRYKQNPERIDSTAYKYLDSLDVGANISVTQPKYYFCLDGLEFVEVDKFDFDYKKEGEYYKQ